nr:hypothetical protein HmN_000499700 [Hymenolepis microstoma]
MTLDISKAHNLENNADRRLGTQKCPLDIQRETTQNLHFGRSTFRVDSSIPEQLAVLSSHRISVRVHTA